MGSEYCLIAINDHIIEEIYHGFYLFIFNGLSV